MLKGSKGRPTKNNNEVKVNELVVEYLTTKENNWLRTVIYNFN